MFSEKAKTNADACRFCWMCRHVCPVGLVTGKEVNNARVKGLLISMVNRGTEFDDSMAKAMWECVLCGSCTNDCKTGYEPPIYIREARTRAVVENLVPEKVGELFNTIVETGNIYGVAEDHKFDAIKDDIKDLPEQANSILYIGEVAALKTPEMAKAVIRLLKKAGLHFTVLCNEPSSGAYLGDLIGFVEEVRQQGRDLSKMIDGKGAKEVIVLDPIEARIMKHEYPEWNIAPKAQIRTVTSVIAELIENGKLEPVKTEMTVTFHDAGALSRDLDETQPARDILVSMGLTVNEMFLSRDLAKSSGGALFSRYSPEISNKLAKARWSDAENTMAKVMVTEAPGSYEALGNTKPDEMQLEDLFTLLNRACK